MPPLNTNVLRTLRVLLLGQFLAALIAGTGLTSELLASKYGVALPTTQSFLNYALILAVYFPLLVLRDREFFSRPIARRKWWLYLIIAAVDVEANYVVVLAYQYTSITSIMLIDCFSIVVVMVLSRFVFKLMFRWQQYGGVAVCILGIVLLVVADIVTGRTSSYAPDPVLGDMLCLIASTLYGISNVMQEYLVKEGGSVSFLGMLGIFAVPISALQSGLLEGHLWVTTDWSTPVVLLMIGFALCLFLLYSLVPYFLKEAGATPLNLSLLTADFYGLLIGIFLFGFEVNALYAFAFVLIIGGVVVYERFPAASPGVQTTTTTNDRLMDEDEDDTQLSLQSSPALPPTSINKTALDERDDDDEKGAENV